MLIRFVRPRAQLAALGAALVVLGGVACSALSTSSPTAATSSGQNLKGPQPPVPAAQPAAAPAGGAPAAAIVSDAAAQRASANPASTAPNASTATIADTSAQVLDRMVIRTAQLTVEVQDIESALAQARQIATRGGGFVSASSTHVERVNDQDRMVADITLQVRSDVADSTVSDLRALGKVTTENSGSQDVTEEYVDLTSNLRNLQASETAILKLMDKASQIQDVPGAAARADQCARSDRAHSGSQDLPGAALRHGDYHAVAASSSSRDGAPSRWLGSDRRRRARLASFAGVAAWRSRSPDRGAGVLVVAGAVRRARRLHLVSPPPHADCDGRHTAACGPRAGLNLCQIPVQVRLAPMRSRARASDHSSQPPTSSTTSPITAHTG